MLTDAIFVVAILPALLAAAAIFDLTSYTIPKSCRQCDHAVRRVRWNRRWRTRMSSDCGLALLAGPPACAGWGCSLGWVGGGDASLP
jgi:hypothetical protein